MLEARSLTKYYNHTAAVKQVSFANRPGEILGYLGPNGAGKSTTVKMVTGLIEPSEGQIFYKGRTVYDDFTGVVGFEWDEESKAGINFRKHGVRMPEAIPVFSGREK